MNSEGRTEGEEGEEGEGEGGVSAGGGGEVEDWIERLLWVGGEE